jgi:prepilin peptidase CpaA
MNPYIGWPVFALVSMATAIDVRTRRIPNWLTMPSLAAGLAVNAYAAGWRGFLESVEGIALAVAMVGALCWIRAMGLGDLKLCAAVGAWIGPASLVFALVIAAMAGGFLALGYAMWRGNLDVVLGRTANLTLPDPSKRFKDLHTEGLTIPYAPAIATGVLFAFLAG